MIRGTAVRIITTIESDESITSIKITITDPNGDAVVDAVNMTLVSGKTYQYIYQSSTGGAAGRYTAVISAGSGTYTAMAQDVFTLD